MPLTGGYVDVYLQQLFPPQQQFISRYSMMMSQQSQPLSHPRHPPPQLSLHPPQQHINKRSHTISLHPQLQVLNMFFPPSRIFPVARIKQAVRAPLNRFYRGEQPELSGIFSFAIFEFFGDLTDILLYNIAAKRKMCKRLLYLRAE